MAMYGSPPARFPNWNVRVLKASREPYTGTPGASGPRSSVGSAIRHPWREPRPDAATERSSGFCRFHCQPKWENPAAGLAKAPQARQPRRGHFRSSLPTVPRRSPQPDCGFPPLRCSSRLKLAADSDQACKRLHGLFAPPWKLAGLVRVARQSVRRCAEAAGRCGCDHLASRVCGVPPRSVCSKPGLSGSGSARRLATIKARRRQSPSAVLGDAQSFKPFKFRQRQTPSTLLNRFQGRSNLGYFSACRRYRIPACRRYRIPACRRSQSSCRCPLRLRSPRPCLWRLRPDC